MWKYAEDAGKCHIENDNAFASTFKSVLCKPSYLATFTIRILVFCWCSFGQNTINPLLFRWCVHSCDCMDWQSKQMCWDVKSLLVSSNSSDLSVNNLRFARLTGVLSCHGTIKCPESVSLVSLADGEWKCGGQGGVFLPEERHLTQPDPASRQACQYVWEMGWLGDFMVLCWSPRDLLPSASHVLCNVL